METFGKICFTLLLLVVEALIGGYVFQTLWGWFITPTFSMEKLTLIESITIMFFINYLKMNTLKNKKEQEEYTTEKALSMLLTFILTALIVLGLGWILTLFM